MPYGKATSNDTITYEHLKYRGKTLIPCLVKMFNSILHHEYVAADFKDSLTVTIHKGNGKSKSDPTIE